MSLMTSLPNQVNLHAETLSTPQGVSRTAWGDSSLDAHYARLRQAIREEMEPLLLQMEKLSTIMWESCESDRHRTEQVQKLYSFTQGSHTLESLTQRRAGIITDRSEKDVSARAVLTPGEVSSEEHNKSIDGSIQRLESQQSSRTKPLYGKPGIVPEEEPVLPLHSELAANATSIQTLEKTIKSSMQAILPGAARIEQGLGLPSSPGTHKEHDCGFARGMESNSRFMILITKLVQSSAFEYFTFLLIATNVIVVGLQIEHMANHSVETTPSVLHRLDIVLCCFFTIDLSLRFAAYRRQFFFMPGWAWNVFDFFFCSLQIAEEIVRFSQWLRASNKGENKVLLVAGVLRAARVCRIFRVTRYSKNLQMLLSCLIHSFGSFFWSVSLMLVIIYAWSIWLTYVTIAHEIHYSDSYSAEKTDRLKTVYGSVAGSVLYLFQGITGGVDWRDIVQPLFETDQYLAGCGTVLIIAFAIIALMNLITGSFVDKAIAHSNNVRQMYQLEYAAKFFESLDRNQNGKLSRAEILEHLNSRTVKAFFKSIDVDEPQAEFLFDMLDIEGTGTIGVSEFLTGCAHLQAPARLANVILVAKESRMAFGKQAEILQSIHGRLCEIAVHLTSGT